ncbi:MAG: hypothetical protein HY735_17790 [Verrucomicrobia bacterium]|nr:hypothetical protein [Verrucomicrobiota bacterium]
MKALNAKRAQPELVDDVEVYAHTGQMPLEYPGLTIEDHGYNGDYGTPLWGDYAIVKVMPGAAVPDMLTAGLFDEHWQLPK